MDPHKNADTDLRDRYPLFFELGLALSLGLILLLFSVSFEAESTLELVETQQEIVLVEEVVQTKHVEAPPPPPRAPAPIEVANNVETEDVELDFDLDLDLTESAVAPAAPPPPPAPPPEPEPEPEPEDDIFVVVEQQPELVGGLQGLQQKLRYPELARVAGIQGTVYVQFVVNADGSISDAVCLRDPGAGTCEEALRAVHASTFEPGRQRGRAVRVRFSMPVRFELR